MYVLKKYCIDPELIIENVKFYKGTKLLIDFLLSFLNNILDYLFSVYLKHKNILSPIKVYTKPENAILYQFPEGGNLAKLYDIRTNGYKV